MQLISCQLYNAAHWETRAVFNLKFVSPPYTERMAVLKMVASIGEVICK